MKLNKKLIEEAKSKDLVCIENDGSVDQLNHVLMILFPQEISISNGFFTYYFPKYGGKTWDCLDHKPSGNYTHYKVTDFYEPEIKAGDLVWCKDHSDEEWEYKGEYLCPDTKKGGHWIRLCKNASFYYDEVKPYKEEIPEYTIEELTEKLGHEFKIKKQ